MRFGERLIAALDARGPLCVGIDPHPQLLAAWGFDVDVDGLTRFCDIGVRAFGDHAAVIKPQSAFFEAFGGAGVAALERTVAACRAAGALVVLDVKRADIGSTMSAYARAYLDPAGPLAADAITSSPYLGVGALQPAFEAAEAHGAGMFVLAATSNEDGRSIQQARHEDGRTVAQLVVDELAVRNAGASPLGSFGVVVGATRSDVPLELRKLNGPILVPGVGAQGGTAADVRRIFAGSLAAVIPAVSRDILRHGPEVPALRDAVDQYVEQFRSLRG
jgi:orotidine-5'-phosphate decarboxylase